MAKGLNTIVVAVAGFVAGILLAPKSGTETRKDLMNKADDAKRIAGEKSEKLRGAMKDGTDTLRSSAKDAGEEMSQFARSAKQSAGRVAGEAKELGREAKSRASHVADNARSTEDALKADAAKHVR